MYPRGSVAPACRSKAEVPLRSLRTPDSWILLPVGLAAGLGFYHLGAKSIWWDEGFSVWVARLDWPAAWHLMRSAGPNMMLYYVLLHFWLWLGLGEAAVRSLSTVAAVACIVPFYFLGKRVLGAPYALLASLLFAGNAFFIRYAQEARGYSLALLRVTASGVLFLRAIDQPTAWRWTAYAVVSALAVYAHFFALWCSRRSFSLPWSFQTDGAFALNSRWSNWRSQRRSHLSHSSRRGITERWHGCRLRRWQPWSTSGPS